MRRVTWLEPRTPHQPGKLQKLSKNKSLLLLSFSESTEKAALYLLKNQSSAGRPQAGATYLVLSREDAGGSFSIMPAFFPDFFQLWGATGGKRRFFSCENSGKNIAEAEFAAFQHAFFAPLAHFAVKSSNRKGREGPTIG